MSTIRIQKMDEIKAFAAGHGVEITDNNMIPGQLEDNALEHVSGGYDIDVFWFYGLVKRMYFENGPTCAFTLFVYYCPSPVVYEIIPIIEDEVAAGNRGYTVDGVYYDCPENDPYFQQEGREIRFLRG